MRETPVNPKRKKKMTERDARQRKLERRHGTLHSARVTPFDPRREADYIAACAARRDARIVSIGVLVFFSTNSGDAWMLDVEDSRAMCVARDGEPQPVTIFETAEKIGIEWTGHFAIDGEAFMVTTDATGRVNTIVGYPIAAIEAALALIRARLAGQ
jgi:hypothetical protein